MINEHVNTNKNVEIIISLSALENNLHQIKTTISGNQKVMAVVKANAYGHGAIGITEFLKDKVDWFAVNTVREGIRLRDAGINNSILVLGVPELNDSKLYKQYNLTATISNRAHFQIFEDATNYHLNIDTGMGRLGILPKEVPNALRLMEKHSEINCTGLYTHFATADDPDSGKVLEQLQTFKRLRQQFKDDLLVHAANTGGVLYYPDSFFDMIRTGIGLYGYEPAGGSGTGLVPILSLNSKIVQLKTLAKGDTVSYGASWEASQKTNIAIIPVGYEDGIRRNLSGHLNVMIEQKLYPVVGTVTMNFCIINLGADRYDSNTKVEVLNQKQITAAHWAEQLHTIPHEILTGLSAAIPRMYRK